MEKVEGDWFNHQKLKLLCYLNYVNYLSWFDKRKKCCDYKSWKDFFLQCGNTHYSKCVLSH